MMRLPLAALAGMLIFLSGNPAQAALTLCNRTSYVLYAATAAIKSPQSSTQGWTRIVPGDCQVARKEPLTSDTYLVHARSSLAHSGPAHAWGGNFPMCVKDANFTLNQAVTMPVCNTEETFALPFAALDTRGKRNWTMTLDETPALASLTAAQLAGVKRLLHDNGFAVGPVTGAPNKQTGAALTAFRKKMRFPADAGNPELFDALETEALKTNAPSGYTVCNDSDQSLQVAVGELEAKPVSRGWWTVPAGSCAKTTTTPLASDAVYLLAQKKNGAVVAGGPEKFCVTTIAFEIQGRGNCAARGLVEAGFARTTTKGIAGYVAHIGGTGVMAPLARNAPRNR